VACSYILHDEQEDQVDPGYFVDRARRLCVCTLLDHRTPSMSALSLHLVESYAPRRDNEQLLPEQCDVM